MNKTSLNKRLEEHYLKQYHELTEEDVETILNNQAIVDALKKYYNQLDFENADGVIDYLHTLSKLEQILSTTYHSGSHQN